jgi:integrase
VVFSDADALLALEKELLREAPAAADRAPHQNIFGSYLSTLAEHTQRYYATALHRFTDFLAVGSAPLTLSLAEEPRLWEKVSGGLVEAFKEWLLLEGYRTSTINMYLRIVKAYAALAHQADMLSSDSLAAIQSVKRIADQAPWDRGKQTSAGHTGVDPLRVERGHRDLLHLLYAVPDNSPRGRRDLVALLLLFELGVLPEEATALHFSDLDLARRRIRVHREMVGALEYLELTDALNAAIASYLEVRRDWSRYVECRGEKTDAPLLVQGRKHNLLFEKHDLEEAREAEKRERKQVGPLRQHRELSTTASWSPQHLWDRVRTLTRQAGLPPLSPYDD